MYNTEYLSRNINKDNINLLKSLCDCYDFTYRVHTGERIVIEDNIGADHSPTLDWLGRDFCGHWEYPSLVSALFDWAVELDNLGLRVQAWG